MTEDDAAVPQQAPQPYPDGTLGMLQRQYDDSVAAAETARALAEQYATIAAEHQQRAADLETAVRAFLP